MHFPKFLVCLRSEVTLSCKVIASPVKNPTSVKSALLPLSVMMTRWQCQPVLMGEGRRAAPGTLSPACWCPLQAVSEGLRRKSLSLALIAWEAAQASAGVRAACPRLAFAEPEMTSQEK